MAKSEPKKTEQSRALGYDPAATPAEPFSRALEYDPAEPLIYKRDATAPLRPLHPENPWRSPILLILGAVFIFSAIAMGVIVSASNADTQSDFAPAPTLVGCTVYTQADTNVRFGPGFDYDRSWILPAGAQREALVRFGEAWFRIDNGWVPREALRLQPSTACLQLPEALSPLIFPDDLPTPSDVLALGWGEILGETFATSINGWAESSDGATLQEGSLLLMATTDIVPRAYPSLSPSQQSLRDAFFAFDVYWVRDGDGTAQVALYLRDGYAVSLAHNGNLEILGQAGQVLAQRQLNNTEAITIGVLAHGERLRVYIDNAPALEAAAQPAPGGYFLTLNGQNAGVKINRFEVKTPRE